MNMVTQAKPSPFKIWWMTLRPATLWAGVAPVFVGGILADLAHSFNLLPFLCALFGSICIQIGCNLVNDYSDFEKGADTQDRVGPQRAANEGWLSVTDLKKGAYFSLGLAVLSGLYLIYMGGLPILILGILSIICAIAYTAGPYPLGYHGLGDLFVLIFFGFGAVGGSFFVQTPLPFNQIPTSVWICGWAVGALATAILVVNNLRDRHTDSIVGKRTLAVRWGSTGVRIEYTFLVLSAFGCLVWQSSQAQGLLKWGWLTPLLLLPLALKRVRSLWTNDGVHLNPLLGQTAKLELLFCLLLVIGLKTSSLLSSGGG